MANKNMKGIRIGNYRIKPLGLAALAGLLMILLFVLALATGLIGSSPEVDAIKPAPTPEVETEPVTPSTPAPTPTIAPTPEPVKRSARVRALGEIAIQENLLNAAKDGEAYNFDNMFSNIESLMGDADYTIADVEGTLGGIEGSKLMYIGAGKIGDGGMQMITPPSLIGTLKRCGVDMLVLANDHALDGNLESLKNTVANCESEGMAYIGAAATKEANDEAKIVEIGGIKVGFVAYTDSLNGLEKKADADSTDFVNLVTKSNAKKDIAACREAGAEIVICTMSWGKMLDREVSKDQQKIAEALAKFGADVIIGYNPHVLQSMKWIETTLEGGASHRALCLYSVGNFLSDSTQKYSDSGVILEFTLRDKADYSGVEVADVKYIPTYSWRIELEKDKYDYRTLAVGEWRESAPESMNYETHSRVKEVWADSQTILGTELASISEN